MMSIMKWRLEIHMVCNQLLNFGGTCGSAGGLGRGGHGAWGAPVEVPLHKAITGSKSWEVRLFEIRLRFLRSGLYSWVGEKKSRICAIKG